MCVLLVFCGNLGLVKLSFSFFFYSLHSVDGGGNGQVSGKDGKWCKILFTAPVIDNLGSFGFLGIV